MDSAEIRELLTRCRVTDGDGFKLKDHDPDEHGGLSKDAAPALLRQGIERLSALQDMLYAQNRWGVLAIFQAMDAAGKDGAIKHVFSGINPQGCVVQAFKAPTETELDHDFLWRHSMALPGRGQIGIHNRSWYEEVLVARIHPTILEHQRLPAETIKDGIWDERLQDIANYEAYLARQGILLLKFFLNVSKDEQRKRFLKRIDQPEKNWKFNAGDVAERRHWDDYQAAYQTAIRATATKAAPWFVVPADRKWVTRLVVVAAICEAMERLKLNYPVVTDEEKAALQGARAGLA